MNKSVNIILISVIVLGGIFYWFEVRPSGIKKNCWDKIEMIKNNELNKGQFDSLEFRIKTQGNQKAIDTVYDNCLREKGL